MTFRRFLLGILLLIVAGIGYTLVAVAEDEDATPSASNAGGNPSPIVGAWMYRAVQQGGHVGAPDLLTFAADGTVLQTTFGTAGLATAHGSWSATSDTTASFTLVSISTAREEGVNGPVPLIQLIQGTVRLSDDGDAWKGELDRAAIWTLSGWKTRQIPPVAMQATRIETGSAWPAFGTPTMGTPPPA